MTTEEQREKERKRWHQRYADPEFRKKAIESSKKRMTKWLEKEENREHVRQYRREYYRKNRDKFREYKRKWREQKKAQEESMKRKETEILEIVQEAREYERTKSIETATGVCQKLVEWADKMLAGKTKA